MPSTEHDVGAVSDFGIGEPARVTVSGRALVVVLTQAGVLAARDVCPHQAARLSDGEVTGTTLRCRQKPPALTPPNKVNRIKWLMGPKPPNSPEY